MGMPLPRVTSAIALTLALVSTVWSGDALPGIVFVSDDIFGPKYEWPGNARPGTNHWREGYIYHRATTQHPIERTTTPTRPGRNLFTLIPPNPDGVLTRITHLRDGEVFDPEPSYDGRRILFSMRRDGEDWFNLYEIQADGTGLRQLTDGPFNDVSGVYLPDDRIVFVSDRSGYLEEYHEERTETLWMMNGNGTGLEQLTFNPGTVFDPTVLQDGRILFSLWDTFLLNIPGADKHETYLMTARPDGAEENLYFGLRQYRFFHRERHSGVAFNQATEMPDGPILAVTEMGPSIVDRKRGSGAADALWPVFPGATTVQLGGATHRVHLSPLGSRSTPYALPDGRLLLSATLPGARDLGIHLCDPRTRAMKLVFDAPETSEFDARPILWQRLPPRSLPQKTPTPTSVVSGVVRSPDLSVVVRSPDRTTPRTAGLLSASKPTSPQPIIQSSRTAHPQPTISNSPAVGSTPSSRSSRVSPAASGGDDGDWRVPVTGFATFVILNGRRSDNPAHEQSLRNARYYRVIEAIPTAVTSSSHTNLATRILGVVPLLRDGSAHFEAPADTPLFLEPLDAAGRRIVFSWNYPVTSVPVGSKQVLQQLSYMTARPGELKACHGCHAPQDETARHPGAGLALAHAPVRVDRDATDILYRRNEPDEYRCQARIGESSAFGAWLMSPEPDLRRRACELLAESDERIPPDAKAMARLLSDESAMVRQAAAFALCKWGTPWTAPALLNALEDEDWLVRFHAATALEAITACPPRGEGESAVRTFYARVLDDLGGAHGLVQALGAGPAALAAYSSAEGPELLDRWCEAATRLGAAAPESARKVVRGEIDVPLPPPFVFEPLDGKRRDLTSEPPRLAAIRAAGWMQDAASAPLLAHWLARHEYQEHASEVAVALGRIGSAEAVDSLWQALRHDVPSRVPYLSRYFQQGPRPEEYAMLRGLVMAGSAPRMEDVHLVFALLPGTFLEKPRYEDRLRPESQRVLLGRSLLDLAGLRKRAVALCVSVLRGDPPPQHDALYQQIVRGINLERPFAEHQRPFPVVAAIQPEQALWFLGCLATDRSEVPESLVVPYLASDNHRERIDAAVLLGRLGFGDETAQALAREASRPYSFKEIMGIGKSHLDPNFRDKCYLVMALARRTQDVRGLATFADPRLRYRDVRYGLAVGLGMRGTSEGIDLLSVLATTDPISVVRRQARESLREIQEFQRMQGAAVSDIRLPAELPYESLYPPRGLDWPAPLVMSKSGVELAHAETLDGLQQLIQDGLQPERYRDLNNANNQAPGATRMMIGGVSQLDRAVDLLCRRHPESALPLLNKLLASPYPFAHYLALRETASLRAADLGSLLTKKLGDFAKAADTVGFYWACEALAQNDVKSAIPVLARYAANQEFPNLHGPSGMGFGYPAAKAMAQLAGDLRHPEVERLLTSENIWLRCGALAGLAEVRAPGIEGLLDRLLGEHQPALVRVQAAMYRRHPPGERVTQRP